MRFLAAVWPKEELGFDMVHKAFRAAYWGKIVLPTFKVKVYVLLVDTFPL